MVSYNIDGKRAIITFQSEAHNALNLEDLNEIKTFLGTASENPDVGVVVLQSTGEKTFCAGANFNQLIAIESHEDGQTFFNGFGNVILAIRNCKKVVVGRIQGRAIGGGVGLAAACDFTIASKFATIRLSELNIGLGPLVIGPMVERKMGLAALTSLSLNPQEWQTAYWAKEKGLYNEVFETQTQCDAYLESFLTNIESMSSEAKTAVKTMLWHDTNHWTELLNQRAAQSAGLLITESCKSEINKFLSKSV